MFSLRYSYCLLLLSIIYYLFQTLNFTRNRWISRKKRPHLIGATRFEYIYICSCLRFPCAPGESQRRAFGFIYLYSLIEYKLLISVSFSFTSCQPFSRVTCALFFLFYLLIEIRRWQLLNKHITLLPRVKVSHIGNIYIIILVYNIYNNIKK